MPVVQKNISGPFKLIFRNRVLPDRFTGNKHNEIPVASTMKKYRTEVVRFAEQIMLAIGYFHSQFPSEKPHFEINHTSLTLTHSDGIKFTFVSERSRDGIGHYYLQLITHYGKQIYNSCFRRYPSVVPYCKLLGKNRNAKMQTSIFHISG